MTDTLPDRGAIDALASLPLHDLMARAAARRDGYHGDTVTYSRKVFIPLTHLCRDVCHYCTFAEPPKKGEVAFLSPEQVLEIVDTTDDFKFNCNLVIIDFCIRHGVLAPEHPDYEALLRGLRS